MSRNLLWWLPPRVKVYTTNIPDYQHNLTKAMEHKVTIETQFILFSRLFDSNRSGKTITLYRSDYWLRQAGILDDRNLTMTDTGLLFFKCSKTELSYYEWCEMLSELCAQNDLHEESVINRLTKCGLPDDVIITTRKFPEVYCNATYDGYLCWPPTLGGHLSVQHCPDVRLSDATQFAFRRCDLDGKWVGRHANDTNSNGWTNYTPCFPPVVQSLFYKVYNEDESHAQFAFRRCDLDGKWVGRHANDTNSNGWTNYTPCFPPVVQSLFYKVYNEDESHAQYKFQIADITRTIEIIGFTLSFISLTSALIILHKFKSLNSLRTHIHKNLFTAMNAQVIMRLIVYIDQAITRSGEGGAGYKGISAIENLYLCITMYILLEYFITVMFMWMLCEGVYLNTIVTNKVLRGNSYYKIFCLLGWLVPMLITASWSILAGVHYAESNGILGCWYGYNFHAYFWIMQGPRLLVILINFGFLLNIMRVLVLKLREDTTSDIVKTRKAVKAAMVLLPLLGITNILSMFEGHVAGPVWQFATWSFINHSLRSFQGAVLAWLYCLGTAEIHAVLKKAYSTQYAIFLHRHPRLGHCLGLKRKRRIQRFPRNTPRFSNTRLETMALPCTGTVWQQEPPPIEQPDVIETEFRETAEIHRHPWVHFNDMPVTTINIPRNKSPENYSPPQASRPRHYPVTPPPVRILRLQKPDDIPPTNSNTNDFK